MKLVRKSRFTMLAGVFLLAIPVSSVAWSQDSDPATSPVASLQHVATWNESDITWVAVELSQKVSIRRNVLTSPDRVYFDFYETVVRPPVKLRTEVNDSRLLQVRVGQNTPRISRVVLDLKHRVPDHHFVEDDPPRLVIGLGGAASTERFQAFQSALQINSQAEAVKSATLETVSGVHTISGPDRTEVRVDWSGSSLLAEGRLTQPDRVYFDLANTQIPPPLQDREFPVADGRLERIHVGQREPSVTRLVFELREDVTYSVYKSSEPPAFKVVFLQQMETKEPSEIAKGQTGRLKPDESVLIKEVLPEAALSDGKPELEAASRSATRGGPGRPATPGSNPEAAPVASPGRIDFVNAHKERFIEAIRVTDGIRIDGQLDELEWRDAEPAANFIQRMPRPGQPATEPTEVRLLYDDENLYVGAYCYDSLGGDGITVTDMSRDFESTDNDGFRMVLDTFDDDRNSFYFVTNPAGGKLDMQTGGDGRTSNRDWDGIWFVATQVTDRGWQAELAIPFKTLRFKSAENQRWGVNFGRRLVRKVEDSYWAPLPPQYRSLSRVSLAGTLDGISGVQQGRNLYFKPYVSAPMLRRENDDVDFQPDVGFDVKYGVTSQLTLDLTVNTDFAQVEADEQQINLTRFPLFFPEKRDFFLENAGIFSWGQRQTRVSRRSEAPDLIPFFSRRIGLQSGRLIPILGGARLTGRAGKYTMGLLSMQTGEYKNIPSTNFSVFRVRRDLLARSDVGGIFVNKAEIDGSFNRTYGADTNLNFFNYLDISSNILRTETPGLVGRDKAGNIEVTWQDQFFDIRGGHTVIEENFNPEVGFVPRTGMKKSTGQFRIVPRPGERIPWIREIRPAVEVNYITNSENVLETKELQGRVSVYFSDSGIMYLTSERTFERLFEPFEIRSDQDIAAGDYRFSEWTAYYRSSQSRMFGFSARVSGGGFWDGERDSYRGSVFFLPNRHWVSELTWSHDDVTLPSGDFKTDLISASVDYAFTTSMFFNALLQYNSENKEVTSNLRFNLIHKPLSDFFIVYNERRSSTRDVLERALIAKLTYVLAF